MCLLKFNICQKSSLLLSTSVISSRPMPCSCGDVTGLENSDFCLVYLSSFTWSCLHRSVQHTAFTNQSIKKCTARRSSQSILKEISPEYSLEGLMLKLKLQYFWPPDVKSGIVGKEPDAGKDWWQEEKGATEDEMDGWHHWLNGHEFEQAPGVGDGQGGLACCSPWGHKESDRTEQSN